MRADGADALTPLKSANEYLPVLFQTCSLSRQDSDVCGNCEKGDQVKSSDRVPWCDSAAQEHGDVGNATGLGAAIALDQVPFIWSSSGSPSAGPPGSRLRLSYRTSKR